MGPRSEMTTVRDASGNLYVPAGRRRDPEPGGGPAPLEDAPKQGARKAPGPSAAREE